MNIKSNIGLIIVFFLIILVIGYGFVPRPILIDKVIVKRDILEVTIEEEGKTRVIDRYLLSAPVDGYARRLDFDVGDKVEKDQRILCLEPLRSNVLDPRSKAEAEAKVSAAKATLSAARRHVKATEADAEFAARELQRLQRLFDSKTISLDKLQQAETNARKTRANFESAQFDVEVAEFEKKAAEATLKYSASGEVRAQPEIVPIRSPVSGKVLKIHHESEGVVSKGTPLLDIGDPLSLEVEVEVLSRDAVKIVPGTRVRFERWGGEQPLEGEVKQVEPVGFTKTSALGVEEQRVLVIVNILSPKHLWQRLGDGYRMETVFILSDDKDVLQIPSSAMFRNENGWAVFLIKEDRAVLKNISPGKRGGITVEILSGLEEGDQVINHPGNKLENNSRVRSI